LLSFNKPKCALDNSKINKNKKQSYKIRLKIRLLPLKEIEQTTSEIINKKQPHLYVFVQFHSAIFSQFDPHQKNRQKTPASSLDLYLK
jgi:hypothetical protein